MPTETIRRMLGLSPKQQTSQNSLEERTSKSFDAIVAATYTNELDKTYFKACQLLIPYGVTKFTAGRIKKNYGTRDEQILEQHFELCGHNGEEYFFELQRNPQVEPGYVIPESMRRRMQEQSERSSITSTIRRNLSLAARQEEMEDSKENNSSIFTVVRAIWTTDKKGDITTYVRSCLLEEPSNFVEQWDAIQEEAIRYLRSSVVLSRYDKLGFHD